MSRTNRVIVNEVGLRDGIQNQAEFVPTRDKLELAQALVDAGIRHMEATSFVSPKAVPQMADAADLFAQLPLQDEVDYSALIPNDKGYELARAAGVRSVAVVLSASDTMNRKNINMSLDEARGVCKQILNRAKEDGLEARGYVAVAFECPYEGLTSPELVMELTDELFNSGATEVIIADTIGAANPTAVLHMFRSLASCFDVERLSAHFHDTRAMALANAWAALQAGIRKFDSSIGGLGGCPFAPGAAGNLATEDLTLMLHQCGYYTDIDVDALVEAVAIASRCVNHPLGGRMMPWLQSKSERYAHQKENSGTMA